MGDLIDKNQLIAFVKKNVDMQDVYLPTHFLELVDEAPSVDGVPAHYEILDTVIGHNRDLIEENKVLRARNNRLEAEIIQLKQAIGIVHSEINRIEREAHEQQK